MPYFLLFLAFTINALASIFLKMDAAAAQKDYLNIFDWAAAHRFLLFGAAAFALNFIFYWLTLRSLPLSVAYPIMVAGSFIIIGTVSSGVFHENISPLQITGYMFVFIGALLVLLNKPA